jgi:hypothetical protein
LNASLPRGIEFQSAMLVCVGGISDIARHKGDCVSGQFRVVGVVWVLGKRTEEKNCVL